MSPKSNFGRTDGRARAGGISAVPSSARGSTAVSSSRAGDLRDVFVRAARDRRRIVDVRQVVKVAEVEAEVVDRHLGGRIRRRRLHAVARCRLLALSAGVSIVGVSVDGSSSVGISTVPPFSRPGIFEGAVNGAAVSDRSNSSAEFSPVSSEPSERGSDLAEVDVEPFVAVRRRQQVEVRRGCRRPRSERSMPAPCTAPAKHRLVRRELAAHDHDAVPVGPLPSELLRSRATVRNWLVSPATKWISASFSLRSLRCGSFCRAMRTRSTAWS
jgi:hypothetical protein